MSDLTNSDIRRYFRNIFGFSPCHLDVYRTALTHKSASDSHVVVGRLNNERLEYLGDAVLSAIVADFLFHKYPVESEGVLTRMRSKLVNRNRLNSLARKIGLHEMIRRDGRISTDTIDGNAFEAVVGAIYLDRGYLKTYEVIINHVFLVHLDMETVYQEDDDYKSRILIWAQRHKHRLEFNSRSETSENGHMYKTVLFMDGIVLAEGLGYSVKKADQAAAEKGLALISFET